MLAPVTINESLARGIRREYFRKLNRAWAQFVEENKRTRRRHPLLPPGGLETHKQLRTCATALKRRMGTLLPVAEIVLHAGSRSADITLALMPDPLPENVTASSNVVVNAVVLTRPGGMRTHETSVVITGHAVDRVIQRCHLMELPISAGDIAAINAEFADALPLACIAAGAIHRFASANDAQLAEELQILLPAAHGIFLANWDHAIKKLIVKTFVSNHQLNNSQRVAIAELQRLSDGEIASHLLDDLTPGWLNIDPKQVFSKLIEAWRHFGWRFDEDRLHPGLSDIAWSTEARQEAICNTEAYA